MKIYLFLLQLIRIISTICLIILFYPSLSFSSSSDTIKKGEKVYNKNCWFCHGQKGDGNSDAAAVLKPKPKNFTDPKVTSELSLDRMIDSVTNGRPKTAMPSFKETLSKKEIHSVVLFIREVIMKRKENKIAYKPHVDGFSYIDFKTIKKDSDLKICLLHCHTDEQFIRSRLDKIN